MKLRNLLGGMALLALMPAGAQEETTGRTTAAIDLLVNGQIRRVVIELYDDAAPQTVDNFVNLSRNGFYNGLAVHRAIPNYVVQMGDPYTRDESQKHLWGTGGPDHSVPAEISLKHERGSVAMAKLPNSNASSGSQFYITLDSQPQLDGKYTVFAKVIRGIEHLDYVAGTTVDTNDVPISRIGIDAITVAGPGGEPAANPNSAILASAAGSAGEAVRGAGNTVAGVIPDKMPKARIPKIGIPFVGKDKDEAVPPPPASGGDISPDPAPDATAADMPAADNRVPPEFDLLEDEIAAADAGNPSPAPVMDAPLSDPDPLPDLELDPVPGDAGELPAPEAAGTPAEAPQVVEDPQTKRKLLSLPAPKKRQPSEDKGLVTRMIERVW